METGELFEMESTNPTRDGLKEFVFHELKHGGEVLPVLRELVIMARDRGWNLPVGADTLRGWARGTVKGFSLHNSHAPFYVAALAIAWPDLRGVLDVGEAFLDGLRDAGWKPSRYSEGGPRHD